MRFLSHFGTRVLYFRERCDDDPIRDIRESWEYLYARKTAIESRIASLEEYERFGTTKPDDG